MRHGQAEHAGGGGGGLQAAHRRMLPRHRQHLSGDDDWWCDSCSQDRRPSDSVNGIVVKIIALWMVDALPTAPARAALPAEQLGDLRWLVEKAHPPAVQDVQEVEIDVALGRRRLLEGDAMRPVQIGGNAAGPVIAGDTR
jgi:hypothetical protein